MSPLHDGPQKGIPAATLHAGNRGPGTEQLPPANLPAHQPLERGICPARTIGAAESIGVKAASMPRLRVDSRCVTLAMLHGAETIGYMALTRDYFNSLSELKLDTGWSGIPMRSSASLNLTDVASTLLFNTGQFTDPPIFLSSM